MKKNLLLLLCYCITSAEAQVINPQARFSCPQPQVLAKPSGTAGWITSTGSGLPISSRPAPEVAPQCPGVINVNIHFFLRQRVDAIPGTLISGPGNFNEVDDGTAYKPWYANTPNDPVILPDTSNNGYARARALVAEMNYQASTNPLNSNPVGSSNPAKGYSYTLNGVYFHRVSDSEYLITKDDYNQYFDPAPFDARG